VRRAWLVPVLVAALGAVSVTLQLLTSGERPPEDRPDLAALLFELVFVGYAAVGALIVSRDRRNLVGWLLLVIALAFALQGLGESYVTVDDAPARGAVGLAAQSLWFAWFAATGIALPLVFPTGRLLTPRWRPVVWLGAAALVLSAAGAAFKPGRLDLAEPVPNPLGASGGWVQVADAVATAGSVLTAIAFALAVTSLIVRIRRSRGTERAQLKWHALVGVLAAMALAIASPVLLFPGGWRDVTATIGWGGFLLCAIVGIPAATGIAILRHGLYDIDVVIRRTLVYGALTATLAGGYLGGVLLAQLIIGAESSFAIALSTLAMAALFRPALARIQALVDRRFYRRRYDARQTLEQFGHRLRDELDLEALGTDLRGVVRDTMQPTSVSLWLRSRE
jgi:hypothetical protein